MSDKKTKYLPVKIAEFEVLERSRTLSQRLQEKTEVEAEKATSMRAFGKRLNDLQGEITRLGTIVRTGEESRDVEVYEEKDFKERRVKTIRSDTHECVDVRDMFESERQGEIF